MISVLIDSSNFDLSVGLGKNHQLIAETSYQAWQQQSELLVAELDKLFINQNLDRKDVNEVIVSKGPGSYTGVRIALCVAKVMAFALNVPLYLCSSLEMMKDPSKPTICVVNARSKRSYVGVYEGEKTLLSDQIMDNDEVLKYIQEHPSYAVSGDVEYLGLKKSLHVDVLSNLLNGDVERNLSTEPLAAKPVYLKDNYPV